MRPPQSRSFGYLFGEHLDGFPFRRRSIGGAHDHGIAEIKERFRRGIGSKGEPRYQERGRGDPGQQSDGVLLHARRMILPRLHARRCCYSATEREKGIPFKTNGAFADEEIRRDDFQESPILSDFPDKMRTPGTRLFNDTRAFDSEAACSNQWNNWCPSFILPVAL